MREAEGAFTATPAAAIFRDRSMATPENGNTSPPSKSSDMAIESEITKVLADRFGRDGSLAQRRGLPAQIFKGLAPTGDQRSVETLVVVPTLIQRIDMLEAQILLYERRQVNGRQVGNDQDAGRLGPIDRCPVVVSHIHHATKRCTAFGPRQTTESLERDFSFTRRGNELLHECASNRVIIVLDARSVILTRHNHLCLTMIDASLAPAPCGTPELSLVGAWNPV